MDTSWATLPEEKDCSNSQAVSVLGVPTKPTATDCPPESVTATYLSQEQVTASAPEGLVTDGTPEEGRTDKNVPDGLVDTASSRGLAATGDQEGSVATHMPDETAATSSSGRTVCAGVSAGSVDIDSSELVTTVPEESVVGADAQGLFDTHSPDTDMPQRIAADSDTSQGSADTNVPGGSNADVPEGPNDKDMPEGSNADMPNDSTNADMPDGFIDADMPDGFIHADMPEGFTFAVMPEGFTDADMLEGSTVADMPEGSTVADMPEGSTDTDMPEGSTDTDMPDGFTDADMQEELADIVGSVDADMPKRSTDADIPEQSTETDVQNTPDADTQERSIDSDMSQASVDTNNMTEGPADPDNKKSFDADMLEEKAYNEIPEGKPDVGMLEGKADADMLQGPPEIEMQNEPSDGDTPQGPANADMTEKSASTDVPKDSDVTDTENESAVIDVSPGSAHTNVPQRSEDTESQGGSAGAKLQEGSGSAELREESPVLCMPEESPVLCMPEESPVLCMPEGSPVLCMPEGSPVLCMPEGSPVLCMPEGSPVLCMPEESLVLCMPEGPAVLCMPEESPDLCMPEESPDLCMPEESPDLYMPTESPDLYMPEESPDLCMPEESSDSGMPTEESPETSGDEAMSDGSTSTDASSTGIPDTPADLIATDKIVETIATYRPKPLDPKDTPQDCVSRYTQLCFQVKAEASSSLSVLSPFAEPFMPRDTAPPQPLTTEICNTYNPLKPPPVPPTYPWQCGGLCLQQQHHINRLYDDPVSKQQEAQDFNMLFEGPLQPLVSSKCFEEASTLAGSRLQKVIENRNKIEGPFNAPAVYFDMLTSNLQPKSNTVVLPVGHERARKSRSTSTSANPLSASDSNTRNTDSSCWGPVYQLFPTNLSSGSGSLLNCLNASRDNLQTEMESTSLFTYSSVTSKDRILSDNSVPVMDSTGSETESGQGMKRSASCFGSWTMQGEIKLLEGFQRTNSSPEIHGGASDRQTASSSRETIQGKVTDCTDRDILDQSDIDNDNVSDGDRTLLAESGMDPWPGNLLADITLTLDDSVGGDKHAPRLDINGNVVDTDSSSEEDLFPPAGKEANGQKLETNCASISTDSGVGSLSDPPSLAKTDSDSECSSRTSPTGSRLCVQHRQELTMYCTAGCEMLCQLCRTDHTQCGRVLDISLACRDLRCRLLKVQSRIDNHIHTLEEKVKELKPAMDGLATQRSEAKNRANDRLQAILKEIHANHERLMEKMEGGFNAIEKGTNMKVRKAERTLSMLNYVNKFLEVLRQQDSGWDLLSTFDQRLAVLLDKVLQTAESNLEFIKSQVEAEWQQQLSDCQKIAFNVVNLVVGSELAEALEDPSTQELKSALSTDEASITKRESFDRAVKQTDVSDGELDWKVGNAGSSNGRHSDNFEEDLMRELLVYLHRFSPLTSPSASSTSTLYSDVMENLSVQTPLDVYDDVFLFESQASGKKPPSEIFARQNVTPEYKIQQRLSTFFPQDKERAFVTDVHVTETGLLVFLDAANYCLKRLDLRQLSKNPACLAVPQPLSMCSAGWNRVMVSSARRILGIYSVGGQQIQLVMPRSTQHQYRGLVRASDSLVAAACPETRSVDLLDLAGRALRSILPVDFVRGPEVVGVTKGGELLVIDQPATPPTTIVCFDMCGKVMWSRDLHTSVRHVSCCKVVGGSEGHVYLALQGDSVIYRIDPDTPQHTVLLNSRSGLKFPSSLALTEDGRVIVTRNELPSGRFPAHCAPMLPTTTEIDVFVHLHPRSSA